MTFFLLALFAGLTAKSQVEFGLRSGLNIANFQSDYPTKTIIAAGNLYYYGGLFVDDKVAKRTSVGLGAEYLVTGAGVNDLTNSYVQSGKYTLQYLALPLQIKYRVTPVLFLETGVELDVLLSGKIAQSEGSSSNLASSFNTLNIGWRVGCGFFVTRHFGIDFHYLYGISNVMNDQNNANLNNRVIQMGFFYTFKK